MRSVAQPVAVITVALPSPSPSTALQRPEQDNHGATLSSLSSISLSPPLVAFSLRLPSRLATHLLAPSPSSAAGRPKLNIHLLSSSQEHLARAFARQPPLPTPASPSPPPNSAAPSHFPPPLFEELHASSLGSMRCSIVHSLPLSELGTEQEGREGKEKGGDTPRSELFVARVEEVTLGRVKKEGAGSLVYWDQEYRAVGGGK